VLNYASDNFSGGIPQIVYVLTVVEQDDNGKLHVRGLYIGDDIECFNKACELAQEVNIIMLDKPLKKAVVYLDPSEFKSTWLGNKAIYRTRMAMADDGELIILGPGVETFGEDPEIDRLVRKYGYTGTPRVMENVKAQEDLKNNLSAAAHLVHGSSEGRFSITYCPGKLSREEIEGVNFKYADLNEMMNRYPLNRMKQGINEMNDGEEVFFVSNPAVGLWACKDNFHRKG
jgi:nickel-dependent lactate racemase